MARPLEARASYCYLCGCPAPALHALPPPRALPSPTQVFTSITPAWNNENLNRLATKLESGLVFAHVRAAYPGMPVSEQNCAPLGRALGAAAAAAAGAAGPALLLPAPANPLTSP